MHAEAAHELVVLGQNHCVFMFRLHRTLYSWELLLAPKRDFRSSGIRYEMNAHCGGTGLGTVQNSFGEPTVKRKPGPEW
jgi:hypothetical protein